MAKPMAAERTDSLSSAIQFEITDLLPLAGATPPRYGRGKWDCPRCCGPACLSVDAGRGLYHCFHAGCNFAGNAGMLARELGLARRLSRAEYCELRQMRERADEAALALYATVKARGFELLDRLHDLNRRESVAHDAGPTEAAWDSLAAVYRERPVIESELDFLENAHAADILAKLAEAGLELRVLQ
ncbi:MAG TPA: hypothetical protein VNM47_02260 [Terriglobia bacterium]|nr:hypothetical protein [Terriglobia bacterium]